MLKLNERTHKIVEPVTKTIQNNIQQIEHQLFPFGTKLLPVTKTFGIEAIQEAYEAGCRQFGENRVQELLPKFEQLPKDIEWHLIGHLQSNKVKYIAPFIALIQSVDSEKLLAEINKQAQKCNRVIPCLLQVYIATEETKFGWNPEEVREWVVTRGFEKYPNIQIKGLMGMASNSSDQNLVKSELKSLKLLFDSLKPFEVEGKLEIEILSMGMSSDYLVAAEVGSTLVRMGSAIFGTR